MRLPDRPATRLLCATLIGVFALQAGLGATSGIGLARIGATTPWFWTEAQYWTVLSSSLLHIGLLHLLANLWFTWIIGGTLEIGIGGGRMLVVFFAGGITGSTLSVLLLDEAVSAGASGGAWGLMLAILALLLVPRLREGTRIRGGPVRPVLTMVALNAAISFLPGVNGLAHLGGGIGGVTALVVVQLLRIPWTPVAVLLHLAHVAALCWAIVDGRPWDPFPERPLVEYTVADELLVVTLPEGARFTTIPDGILLRTPELDGFSGEVRLVSDPVRLEVVYAELLARLGGESTEIDCPGTCRAARVDRDRTTVVFALRQVGDLTIQTLVMDLTDHPDWAETAVVATRLGPRAP